MTVMVALLRGINVGGHNKLPMADLRGIVDECGYGPAQTYIQSGNVIMPSADDEPDAVASRLHDAIQEKTGIDTPVIVRTAVEMAEVVDQNPYLVRGEDPAHLHVLFLDRSAAVDLGDLDRFTPEEATADGPHVQLFLPGGVGRSKLAAHLARQDGARGTMRSWRTVTKLLASAGDAKAERR